jgi:hypothetical protein
MVRSLEEEHRIHIDTTGFDLDQELFPKIMPSWKFRIKNSINKLIFYVIRNRIIPILLTAELNFFYFLVRYCTPIYLKADSTEMKQAASRAELPFAGCSNGIAVCAARLIVALLRHAKNQRINLNYAAL